MGGTRSARRGVGRALMSWRELLCQPLPRQCGAAKTGLLIWASAMEADAAFAHAMLPSLRQAAALRRVDMEQELRLASLLPRMNACERVLVTLFSYMEMAASTLRSATDARVRQTCAFLLPEVCDMLYRAANLLSLVYGASADRLLQGMAELIPGRPCMAAHRHPQDDILPNLDMSAAPQTLLHPALLRAMARYCARLATLSTGVQEERESALYAEFALALGGHQAQWESLLGPPDPCHALCLHEYAECYLYHSLAEQEADAALSAVYADALEDEKAHLREAVRIRHAATGQADAFPLNFPPPLTLEANKGVVRDCMHLVGVTMRRGRETPVGSLPGGADFFRYQKRLHGDGSLAPSHVVVDAHIRLNGEDYRRQIAPHPIEMLRGRTRDVTWVGRGDGVRS